MTTGASININERVEEPGSSGDGVGRSGEVAEVSGDGASANTVLSGQNVVHDCEWIWSFYSEEIPSGVRLRCQTLSEGVGSSSRPVLILLHGCDRTSRVFEPTLKKLTQYCDVLCLDLPGYGNNHSSFWQGLAVFTQRFIDDIATVAGQRSVFLCGWSLGGLLATKLASAAPTLFDGLITVATHYSFVKSDSNPRKGCVLQGTPTRRTKS